MLTDCKHFIDFSNYTKQEIFSILEKAYFLYKNQKIKPVFRERLLSLGVSPCVVLVFFESSTRTRLSFETAVARMGLHPIIFDVKQATSLEKGETLEDTLLNILAMQPAMIVLRCNDDFDLVSFLKKRSLSTPFVNAGWGTKYHPTQALGDILTILLDIDPQNLSNAWVQLQKKRITIVGDVVHSRVAGAHFQLAEKLGYEVFCCGPDVFLPKKQRQVSFNTLNEALRESDYVMSLRMQFERHQGKSWIQKEEYIQQFQISSEKLDSFNKKIKVLHPGPVNWGIELNENILTDARQIILQQVQSGVLIRQSILETVILNQYPTLGDEECGI